LIWFWGICHDDLALYSLVSLKGKLRSLQ